ncbi:MAG: phosphonate metabolism protein/1,5-bisphosphokinase (PRPP-forming) PhnN [Betaproteobacteria bacterium]|nr:phosphonate metabolism protein/1,5-bisphosphokinase (PRPP-forming) PhnN [Betaproteobacteria bacterium]
MIGTLVYIMGPSGSGKDSLIAYARRSMNAPYALTWNAHARQGLRPVLFARRYITRPAIAGGERHIALTQEEFRLFEGQGGFSLSWKSHGLRYGIGSEIDLSLAEGAVVVVSGSRKYLPEAMKIYPELIPLLISARPDVLRGRLEKRGREASAEIGERLLSASMKVPDIPGLIRLDNSDVLEKAGAVFADLLSRLRRARAFEAGNGAFSEPLRLRHKTVIVGRHSSPVLAFA